MTRPASFFAHIGMLAAGASASALAALRYRPMMPVTDRNIGRNWLKYGQSRHPHCSARQRARYARQIAAGQLRFRAHAPTGHPGKGFAKLGGIR